MNLISHPTPKSKPNSFYRLLRLALIILVSAAAGFMTVRGLVQFPLPDSGGTSNPGGLSAYALISCGDGYCNGGETCSSCSADCGTCPEPNNPPPAKWECGNGICETDKGEGVWNCSQDCNWCGDNVCRPEEVDTCCGAGNDCTVAITCGDGICSACESNANCPTDCDVVEVTVTEESPTATLTQAPIVSNEGEAETETEEPSETPTATETENPEETSTPTETPTPTATATETPTPEPDTMGNCRIVNEDVIAEALITAANANQLTGIEGFIAGLSGDSRKLWVICDEPPETVCLPALDLETLDGAHWLDCASSGPACTDIANMELVSGEVCVSNTSGSLFITCAEGCTLREDEDIAIGDYVLPLIILLLLLALIIMLIFLATSRRKREDDEEEGGGDDDDYGPETIAL